MTNPNVILLGDRVMVRRVTAIVDGLEIPIDDDFGTHDRGEIVAVSPNFSAEGDPIGHIILFSHYEKKVKIGNEEFLIIKSENIMGRLYE